ncbi:MAG: hypothetical protein M3Z17_08135 [Gemmatimonadota bacterium]|nr:hypothetical protein [Gemmatimonadota bacterium]
MRIGRMVVVFGASLAGGIASALPVGAQTTAVAAGQPAEAPYINVSLLGTDLLVRPQRLRYRITTDPGAYVTIILISPHGQRSVLNPYEKAFAGTGRREMVRDASTGYQTGESYLVAIATRSQFHSSNLQRQSEAAARLASAHFSAEGSLDELLTSILPAAGNDFSVAYLSFRVVSRGMPMMLQYANRCPISGSYAAYGSINDGFYRRQVSDSWLFDDFQDETQYFNFLDQPYFASACQDRLIVPPVLVAALPVPVVPPQPPRDTSVVQIDSVPHAGAPTGPIIHNPVAPRPFDVETFSGTIGRAMTPLPPGSAPVSPAVPAEPVAREPLSPVNLAPRIDPIVPVQREPVSQPPVPMEPRAMPAQPMQPMTPPPSPPPPRVSSPTPLPPATGTGPASPPPR